MWLMDSMSAHCLSTLIPFVSFHTVSHIFFVNHRKLYINNAEVTDIQLIYYHHYDVLCVEKCNLKLISVDKMFNE